VRGAWRADTLGMTDTIDPPIGLSVVVRERRISNRSTILDIEYDGSQPPSALLADLRALGWDGAVVASPRADVIDWNQPDPVRGTRYSILPHLVVIHASLQGDAETCGVIRRQTQAVLGRHGFADVAGPTSEPGAGTTQPAAAELVDILAPKATVPAVEAVAGRFGTIVEREDASEVVEATFRGNVRRLVYPLRRVRIRMHAERYDELVNELSTVGIRGITRVT
jgi:hypothetical protein